MTIVTGGVRGRDGNLLANATVHLIRRDTGALLGSAVSGDGSPAIAADDDFANVSLLLHCNGTNNSQIFTDDSPSPTNVVAHGAAKLSTDRPRFGSSSAYFSPGNDGIERLIAAGAAGSLHVLQKFTVQCSVLVSNWDTYSFVMSYGSGFARSWAIQIHPLYIRFICYDISNELVERYAYGTFNLNQYYDLDFVKSGDSLTIGVNGQVKSITQIPVIFNSPGPLEVGNFMGYEGISHCFRGMVDEVRITKNVARPIVARDGAFLGTGAPAKPLGMYAIDTDYVGEVIRVVAAPDALSPFANDLIDRIILP